MGSFANSLFTIMIGWLQNVVYSIWNAFSSEQNGSFLKWIGRHWIIVAAILCAAGLIIDFTVYMVRWKPFKVWRSFFSRRNRKEPQAQDEYDPPAANQPFPQADPGFDADETVVTQESYRNEAYAKEKERRIETEEIEQRIVQSGKRRRSNRILNEMNDGLQQYPPVDRLINSNEAYYRPVFPQNWREQENDDDQ